jgi:hypothetical protein
MQERTHEHFTPACGAEKAQHKANAKRKFAPSVSLSHVIRQTKLDEPNIAPEAV